MATGGFEGDTQGLLPLLLAAEESKKVVNVFIENSARFLIPSAGNHFAVYTNPGNPLGYEKHVVVQSPREYVVNYCARNIIRRGREVRVVQGEGSLGRREDILLRREQRLEEREILVDQREAKLHSAAISLDAEKKELEDEKLAYKLKIEQEAAQAVQQVATDRRLSLAALDAAKKLEAVDSCVTQDEKVLNVPSRMQSIKESFAKNREVLKEAFKGAGATAFIRFVKRVLKDELDLGGEDDSTDSSNGVPTNGTSNGSNGVATAKGPNGGNGSGASNGSVKVGTNGSVTAVSVGSQGAEAAKVVSSEVPSKPAPVSACSTRVD